MYKLKLKQLLQFLVIDDKETEDVNSVIAKMFLEQFDSLKPC